MKPETIMLLVLIVALVAGAVFLLWPRKQEASLQDKILGTAGQVLGEVAGALPIAQAGKFAKVLPRVPGMAVGAARAFVSSASGAVSDLGSAIASPFKSIF